MKVKTPRDGEVMVRLIRIVADSIVIGHVSESAHLWDFVYATRGILWNGPLGDYIKFEFAKGHGPHVENEIDGAGGMQSTETVGDLYERFSQEPPSGLLFNSPYWFMYSEFTMGNLA